MIGCANLWNSIVERRNVLPNNRPCIPSQINVLPLAMRCTPLTRGEKNVTAGCPLYCQTISLEFGSISKIRECSGAGCSDPFANKIMCSIFSNNIRCYNRCIEEIHSIYGIILYIIHLQVLMLVII